MRRRFFWTVDAPEEAIRPESLMVLNGLRDQALASHQTDPFARLIEHLGQIAVLAHHVGEHRDLGSLLDVAGDGMQRW